jgi:3-hydroxybutyryl-CoA dehydrogenase
VTQSRTASTVAVIGAGTMGRSIVRCFGTSGFRVRTYDARAEAVAELVRAEGAPWLEGAASLEEAVQDCEVVIEAVAEDAAVKADVLRRVSAAAPAECLVATNTSSLPVDDLAEHVQGPERFLGLHFFNPAELVPGVEVIAGRLTSPATATAAVALMERIGKRPSTVASAPGFVANRLQMALFLESLRCVEEGLVSMQDLDTIVSSTIGFRLPAFGPFVLADMAGLDVYASILGILEAAYGDRFATPAQLVELTASGRLGLKSGGGFSDYGPAEAAELVARRDDVYRRLGSCLEDPTPG